LILCHNRPCSLRLHLSSTRRSRGLASAASGAEHKSSNQNRNSEDDLGDVHATGNNGAMEK
jgi:hypothetical protein